MLVILGFAMILTFMALIMTKRLTPMVALILVPTIFGLFAGAGLGMGDMILDSLKDLAPTAALLMFAIMFFGIMIDVGLFDPLIRLIVRFLGDDPAKVVVGTAILAGAVSLDGDGSTTFIITVSALLPVYLRLGMSPVILTCTAGLVNGTLNIVPWGGPTARAASALGVSPSDIFTPMLPSLGIGLLVAFALVWLMGLSERKRLAGTLTASKLMREEAESKLAAAGAGIPKLFRGARADVATGPTEVDVAINATPLGLAGHDPLPVDVNHIPGAERALDLVYSRGETRWVHALRERGIIASDGREMLVQQGAAAFERFFPGTDAPTEVMRAAVERALRV